MAKFTIANFREVKEAIKKDREKNGKKSSNVSVSKSVGWSREVVRLVRKVRSYAQYKEVSKRRE